MTRTRSRERTKEPPRSTSQDRGDELAPAGASETRQCPPGAHGPTARRAGSEGAPAAGVRVVVVDVDTLRTLLRDLLAELLSGPASPEFYSQECLPPGMSRRAFLDAIRRGDLPARASGKARFVARADYQAFIKNAPPVRVRLDKQPTPANDVRALVRTAQGKR